jgi:4'-phosphopantetheinyl transferase
VGRWAAKAALCAWTGAAAAEVQILASSGGGPRAFLGSEPAPAALSLSHRGGRALAMVADSGESIGCDLEVVEPRSGAFERTWLTTAERAQVELAGEAGRARTANLIWAAKEAAAKARHEGLRLDVRAAAVELEEEPSGDGEWKPLRVRWDCEAIAIGGWWREEPGWVFAFVSGRATRPPTPL